MIKIAKFVVREPATTMNDCLRSSPESIDLSLLETQYSSYLETLKRLGFEVTVMSREDESPDCVFIEDTGVILDHQNAVITSPGAPSRRSEVNAVRRVLQPIQDLTGIDSPGMLDGGDVLRIDQNIFVGLSTRTNSEGAQQLASAALKRGIKSHLLKVPSGLHLKSVCSLASENVLLFDEKSAVDFRIFEALGIETIPVNEFSGANVLAVGNNRVLVSEGAPLTASLLRTKGYDVIVLNVSEFHKADGALTCLSLRIPADGYWCT